jgi:putative transposase
VTRFRLIEAEKAQHPVSLLCGVLGVTRGGYYAWRRREPCKRKLEDERLAELIAQIFEQSQQTYGAPRIHAELADDHGLRVGKKRVARLMRGLGVEGISRRGKRRYKTTIPAKEQPTAPDLVRRSFQAAGPNRLWVADITYVSTWEGYLFLACVIDAWSRRIVGWSMRDDLKADLVVDALGMALTRRQPQPGLVHHSDSESVGCGWLRAT